MKPAAKQSAEAFEEKVGLDRRGRRRGSRITPIALLALTIMLLFTRSFDPYSDIELVTMRVDSPADIRGQGKSLVIVAREGQKLHFRVFGHEAAGGGEFGRQLVPPADQDGARADAVELIRLRNRLDDYAADPTTAEKARIIDSVLSITGVRVQDLSRNLGSLDLRKSVLGVLASVSTVMLDDIPAFLWGQLRTIGVVAALSLIPGLGGMVYRRAFKQ